jgi:hypothetical protein
VRVAEQTDAATFLADAEPLLLADEARANLVLGIAGTLRDLPAVTRGARVARRGRSTRRRSISC